MMKKQTVFIKRYPSKGELPSKSGMYLTNLGIQHFIDSNIKRWVNAHPQWFMEEIELPSVKAIDKEAKKLPRHAYLPFNQGANFILNKLKGG